MKVALDMSILIALSKASLDRASAVICQGKRLDGIVR